jgi:hypothetical protein
MDKGEMEHKFGIGQGMCLEENPELICKWGLKQVKLVFVIC